MLLLEEIPNDEQAIMERLGMPADSPWIWLSCPNPVAPTALNVTLRLRDRTGQVEQVRPSSALTDWYGLSFEVFGRTVYESQVMKGHPFWRLGGRAVIEAWHGRAFNVAEGVEAIAIWAPPKPARVAITHAGLGWTVEAVGKARAAVDALHEFERAAGGRHQLEDDPDSGWIELTRRALDLKRERPSREWKGIAKAVGVSVSTLRDYRTRYRKMGLG